LRNSAFLRRRLPDCILNQGQGDSPALACLSFIISITEHVTTEIEAGFTAVPVKASADHKLGCGRNLRRSRQEPYQLFSKVLMFGKRTMRGGCKEKVHIGAELCARAENFIFDTHFSGGPGIALCSLERTGGGV